MATAGTKISHLPSRFSYRSHVYFPTKPVRFCSSQSNLAIQGAQEGEVMRPKRTAPVQIQRQFVTEIELETITGRSRRTWQKDRLFGRGAPFYRVGGSIYYDLKEALAWMKSQRGGGELE
jgi:hypothetical protein